MLRNLAAWQTVLQDRRVPKFLAMLFSLLILVSLYNLIAIFWHSHNSIQSDSRQERMVVQRVPNIASWHLFGVYRNPLLPMTQLDLVLQGIFAADPVSQSQALISVSSQTGKLYGIGDIVPGGAKIDRILFNRVILLHNGKSEALPIIRPKLQFATQPQDLTATGE